MRDNVELLANVVELGSLFTGTRSLDDFLQKVVSAIAEHMHVPVCSIYLLDESSQELHLRATLGLSSRQAGRVSLRPGEGITGTALKELRTIRESRASANPNFKFFPGLDEERYEAFLAVPIVRGLRRIGVLVVQHHQCGYFDENDAAALRAISSQLAGAIENTKLFLELSAPAEGHGEVRQVHASGASLFIRGTSGSPGFAWGRAAFYGMLSREENLLAAGTGDNHGLLPEDFERALATTESELEQLQDSLAEQALDLQSSLIFNAHLLILKDPAFSGRIRELIKAGQAPCAAVIAVVAKFVDIFSQSSNPRLREKVQDVNDLGHRLLRNLTLNQSEEHDYSKRIVIAGELLPSDMLKISTQKASGLIIAEGAFTAHITILARSLSIPLVVARDQRLFQLSEHDEIVIDAAQGTIYVNPEATVLDHYQRLEKARKEASASLDLTTGETELRTADHTPIKILANINLISEIPLARQLGAEGIGLYRSEFPFLVRNDFPPEEEQYRIYRKIIDEMKDREVTFRTLDIGGDKMLSYFPSINEANPFLGLRSIRFSLQYKDIFQQQLRALLRAGAGANMRIMFPLISSLDDFLEVKEIVGQCIEQLTRARIEFNSSPQLGVMVELPSAIEIADELAQASDFLCLGTNDLTQYMLAADRTNPDIAHYYLPHHPAVLRALNRVVTAARRASKPLSICGEMVSESTLLPFLLGIGIRNFSLDPNGIKDFRQKIRSLHLETAESLALAMLNTGSIKQIENILQKGN